MLKTTTPILIYVAVGKIQKAAVSRIFPYQSSQEMNLIAYDEHVRVVPGSRTCNLLKPLVVKCLFGPKGDD